MATSSHGREEEGTVVTIPYFTLFFFSFCFLLEIPLTRKGKIYLAIATAYLGSLAQFTTIAATMQS